MPKKFILLIYDFIEYHFEITAIKSNEFKSNIHFWKNILLVSLKWW
jgi:hypothetical protein